MKDLLVIYYLFAFAFLPKQELTSKQTEVYNNTTHIEFELSADVYNMIRVFGGEETYQLPEKNLSFNPYRQAYWIGLEYHKEFNNSLSLRFGVQHKCTHPVNSWEKQLSKNNEDFTEIYVSLSGRVKVF